jgi:hypothetical protein
MHEYNLDIHFKVFLKALKHQTIMLTVYETDYLTLLMIINYLLNSLNFLNLKREFNYKWI